MNEQLIQQIAQQIDGQVAQAVGSQDPQAKGGFLWQKYPQVHSCANYNDAVMLLAREQAALQQPQPQQQSQGFGAAPPAQGFGAAPQQGFDQQQGFGVQLSQQQGFGMQQQQAPGFGDMGGFGQQVQGFGQPPQPNVFGTPAVPQAGQPGAAQFNAFKAPATKGKAPGKVFGFIPSNVFAIILIGVIAVIVVGGIIMSIINATKPKVTPPPSNPPAYEETYDGGGADSLFD